MPVPSDISELSTTASGNSPAASESATTADNYFRAHAAFIAQLRDSTILRNRLINGNFKINQRNAASGSTAYAAGAYVMDRWKAGAGGCTLSWAASGADVIVTITAGSLLQVVEDVNVEGGIYALANRGTAQARIAINGASLAGAYAAASASAPLLSASATGGQAVMVEFSTGTLDRVQLEPGTAATPFERRPNGQELALCQRYYEIVRLIVATSVAPTAPLATGYWKVTKRAIPALSWTFDSGTGATYAVLGHGGVLDGVFQNVAHSIQATAAVTGNAEL
jgi:hypothetical protein